MNFIDHAKIYVKSGNGGNGCVAFLREKFRPKGGPCGGDGGNGGNIIFLADSNLSTLHDVAYKKKYFAKRGEHGKGKNMQRKHAELKEYNNKMTLVNNLCNFWSLSNIYLFDQIPL